LRRCQTGFASLPPTKFAGEAAADSNLRRADYRGSITRLGAFYALDGICPHQGGPLGKGFVNGCIVTCPWHGFQFDVTTGQHQTSKSLVQPTLPVKEEAGEIFVDVEGS
jgi:nitrite reductase/ring-hydroxylating ferredoxin subunit